MRYARTCFSYVCFIPRAVRHSNKLLGQGYIKEHLKSSLRKFHGRHGILPNNMRPLLPCNTTFWRMTIYSDTLHWSDYTNFWTLLQNLTFYLNAEGFHRIFETGATCQLRTLSLPVTWSCPTLGLACVHMLRPISPELVVLFPDFWVSNIPQYFSFASIGSGKSMYSAFSNIVGICLFLGISFTLDECHAWFQLNRFRRASRRKQAKNSKWK